MEKTRRQLNISKLVGDTWQVGAGLGHCWDKWVVDLGKLLATRPLK